MNNSAPDANAYRVDKKRMSTSFGAAAASYDQVAVLQREVAKRLADRLDLIKITPLQILDAGSGTGYCSGLLAQRYPKAHIVALDIAYGMLQTARGKLSWWERMRGRQDHVCGDIESLPLADASVDMVFSSLAIQWCHDLDSALREFRRVLKPGGLVMFATLGPDTLRELRTSWASADSHTHVSLFIDMHDIGDGLMRAGFADPVMDAEHFTLTYPDANLLMRDLKQLGSRNATAGRAPGLTGKGKLNLMRTAYERYRRDGHLPATYEVAYGHAWTPLAPPPSVGAGKPFPVAVKTVK